METKRPFWWLKNAQDATLNSTVSKSEREISSSLAEYLEKEQEAEELDDEVDIPSILEEISRLSAKSPLGQYQKDIGQLSIDEIMREAEKIYMESSKSFEQLSQRSKTSQNISDLSSGKSDSEQSTPTPKSLSPLPLDERKSESESDTESLKAVEMQQHQENSHYSMEFDSAKESGSLSKVDKTVITPKSQESEVITPIEMKRQILTRAENQAIEKQEELEKKDSVIKVLLSDNKLLKEDMKKILLEFNDLKAQRASFKSPELNKALEALKDTQEQNTALHLQLEEANKSNSDLRTSYDELLTANNILERRLIDLDSMLGKYKSDLKAIQNIRDKLKENEFNTTKQVEHERQQVKTLKQQVDKDAKCIMDLNRQIKEMERIIARKHPDSVSALIVASKNDDNTARKVLEDRIKTLEQEALIRDAQNSQVFIDVQEKFNQMKLKYESHIDDLELHVNDLKSQLKRRNDSYDVYTQTIPYFAEKIEIPAKDTTNRGCQTDAIHQPPPPAPVVQKAANRKVDPREDTHLIATIRGYQADLSNKEKVIVRMQKDLDELRKTNRRLQKEREGSLRNLSKCTDNKSTLTSATSEVDEIRNLRTERDKMKAQLCRIEEDYQALKEKRLKDLNTLQEAHEREISTYLANITPLREQLEVQTVSLSTLQKQLLGTKEDLAVVTVERDHLNNKLTTGITSLLSTFQVDNGNEMPEADTVNLRKQLNLLELKYEERENRLRAIVHGLAQKSVTNRSCEQCSDRQKQLIGYKAELDQIIATLRCLK